jgi:hypothetical protein
MSTTLTLRAPEGGRPAGTRRSPPHPAPVLSVFLTKSFQGILG